MTPWQLAALVLGAWVALAAAFCLGWRWAGARRDADEVVRIATARRQAIDDVIGALSATQAHGGDCDTAFRQMAAIIFDQQIDLLAYKGYVAQIEGAGRVGDETEDWLHKQGGEA